MVRRLSYAVKASALLAAVLGSSAAGADDSLITNEVRSGSNATCAIFFVMRSGNSVRYMNHKTGSLCHVENVTPKGTSSQRLDQRVVAEVEVFNFSNGKKNVLQEKIPIALDSSSSPVDMPTDFFLVVSAPIYGSWSINVTQNTAFQKYHAKDGYVQVSTSKAVNSQSSWTLSPNAHFSVIKNTGN